MSHTPTPWYSAKFETNNPEEERIYIQHKNLVVAEVVHADMEWEEYEDNAELIVQAVNSHQAMKEALERIANSIVFVMDAKPLKKFAPAFQAIIDETEKALLLANGGTSE